MGEPEPTNPTQSASCHIPSAKGARIFVVGHMATLTGAPIGLQQLAEQLRDCGAIVEMLFIIGGEFEHIVRLSGIPYRLGMVAVEPAAQDLFIVNTIAEASAMWVRAQVEQFGAAFLRRLVWWVQELHNIELPDKPTMELLAKASEVVFVAGAAHEHWTQIHHSVFGSQFGFPNFRTIYLALGHEWLERDCQASRVGGSERTLARQEMNMTVDDYVVLHMGQIIPHKGVIELIHAAKHVMAAQAALQGQQPMTGQVQILLVGPAFAEQFLNRVKALIRELHLEASVQLVKPVTNPHTYYKLADVFIMNSECENFARVVLEAMAMSLPVLGTRCGGTVEQVTEHVSGLLHSFGNAKELAQNIMKLDTRTPGGLEANIRMGRAGCTRAQSEFDINLKFAEWDRVVHSVRTSARCSLTPSLADLRKTPACCPVDATDPAFKMAKFAFIVLLVILSLGIQAVQGTGEPGTSYGGYTFCSTATVASNCAAFACPNCVSHDFTFSGRRLSERGNRRLLEDGDGSGGSGGSGSYTLTYNVCQARRGAGCGKPLLTGYDGRTFDFEGQAGHTYNLLTEQKHQLNVRMSAANLHDEAHAATGGTVMTELSFQYRDHVVMAEVDVDGNMTVSVDGRTIPSKYWQELYDGEVSIESEPFFPQAGHVAVVSSPMVILRVQAVRPFNDSFGQLNRGHIGFSTTLLEKPHAMHGILGQTLFSKAKHPLGDTQFHGEGTDADYQVSSLSAADSKFNLFGVALQLPSHGRVALETEPISAPITLGSFSTHMQQVLAIGL
ncbi:hypothetical protein WJX72_011270 [[Myrmecia] bisecta]|uniref:Glycosyl transferase family 1 domain-containing protein n=1 Tax=[Myrmecia] bisecta TaxID=41462 RepID=A0AAW1Q206_9CHLO